MRGLFVVVDIWLILEWSERSGRNKMTPETTIHSINLIVSNPKVRNGRPYIAGTTITVADIAIAMVYHQLDASGIADYFRIDLEKVHAALAYYYANRDAMDEQIRALIKQGASFAEGNIPQIY